MAKQQINETQYTELVNRKMQEHAQFKPGMGVKLNPEGSARPSGLTLIGGDDARGIMSWAVNEVKKEYEVVVTP